MKVKTAAQVLSQSVSAAIMNYICSKKLPPEALATAQFLKRMDSLFDVFNSSGKFDPKVFRTALHKESLSLRFLEECLDLLGSIKVVGVKVQPPCINGWRVSIKALLALWEDVESIDGIDVQDFQQRYKLLLRACISNSVLSKCEDDSAAVLFNVLNVAPRPEDPPVRSDESVGESLVLNEHIEALDPKEAQGNVLLYIAGYVAYRFLRAHSCSQCEAAVLGAAEDHVPDSMVLIAAKAYRCDRMSYIFYTCLEFATNFAIRLWNLIIPL
ncbi:hypothetical protein CAPTEDRAFT_194063 [Capitella teleta]|uniref:Transposable element P transposase-like GTP-binding insertion domain-containing protein n=1 Tax=Capitella teleta TaxID=283909 RepID=R7UW29_CAPTE|nr:hypothetical protein CAPTEDRAFT_194063 [Capitella teleta]|eukprot:ELU10539.1 hypothetical protein CAPTEDRAFT_194063 [Capitella teleta]